MAYNHAKEENRFKEQWEQKEKLYRESGIALFTEERCCLQNPKTYQKVYRIVIRIHI